MDIGNRIKERRQRLGLTADDLAEKVNKSRATIYRYENGDISKLPTTVLEPLAEALQTTPAYLMGWVEDPESKITPIEPRLKRQHMLESYFNRLNWDGQDKVIAYAADLAENPKYRTAHPYLLQEAAHERGDIEITAVEAAHDSSIMLDDKEWE